MRVHPETGERSLVLGGFVKTVRRPQPAGVAATSPAAAGPRHQAREHGPLAWRQGDLAIWDNRATQHYAVADYGTAHRRGERVTVAGPVPVGVDGRPSVAVRGDASAYYVGGADH